MKKIMLSMFCIFLLVGCSTKQENITIKKNNNQETVDLKVGFGLHQGLFKRTYIGRISRLV